MSDEIKNLATKAANAKMGLDSLNMINVTNRAVEELAELNKSVIAAEIELAVIDNQIEHLKKQMIEEGEMGDD